MEQIASNGHEGRSNEVPYVNVNLRSTTPGTSSPTLSCMGSLTSNRIYFYCKGLSSLSVNKMTVILHCD